MKKTSVLDAPRNDALANRYGRIRMPAVAAAAAYEGTKSKKGEKRKFRAEQQDRRITRHGGQTTDPKR
jgi:hypothetical protein